MSTLVATSAYAAWTVNSIDADDDVASTTYEAFGCFATVRAMKGSTRAFHGAQGWYEVFFVYPANPSDSWTDRSMSSYAQVMAAIRCQIGRNLVDPEIVATTGGGAA